MLVPNYEQKLKKSAEMLANRSDEMSWWHTYEASVMSYERSDLGVAGEDFLIVAIEEIDEPCRWCHFAIFGAVDLTRMASMGSFRSADAANLFEDAISFEKTAEPWKIILKYAFPSSNASCAVDWQREALADHDQSRGWRLLFGKVAESHVGECK